MAETRNSHWPLAFHAFPTLVETKRNPDETREEAAGSLLNGPKIWPTARGHDQVEQGEEQIDLGKPIDEAGARVLDRD